jgi:hypothetical protein
MLLRLLTAVKMPPNGLSVDGSPLPSRMRFVPVLAIAFCIRRLTAFSSYSRLGFAASQAALATGGRPCGCPRPLQGREPWIAPEDGCLDPPGLVISQYGTSQMASPSSSGERAGKMHSTGGKRFEHLIQTEHAGLKTHCDGNKSAHVNACDVG